MDLKTSLLVSRQLPEFVRDEYPLFVSFLEAYYEFLETERYTDGVSQKNNLIEKLKDLKNISDIDFSLDDFEDQFFNTFISYLPKDTLISKDFLIKNILPLYQTKGTQKSFQYLFRLLFGEEIQIEYPGERVLRTSDGKWTIENIVRTELEIYSEYISDGQTTIFNLPYEMDSSQLHVTMDGNIIEDFYVRKELQKLYLSFIPTANSVIKIYYLGSFNLSIFRNRQILGKTSNATSIIEKIARRNIAGLNFYQFFVDDRNTLGIFRNGEIVEITVFNSSNNLISFHLQTLSDVRSLEIVEPGSNYSVGDEVILRGSATERAIAVVDDVSSGNIESLSVKIGNFGAGYKVNNEIYANNFASNVFSAIIDAVDDSGTISPNTFEYNNIDFISDFLSINISDPDYGFASNVVESENVNTVIAQALSTSIVTNLGPATNVSVILSQIPSNINVEFFANSTLLYDDVRISNFNSIGTINILNPGSGYSVGDEIIFTNTEYFSGQGAKAFVSAVNSVGGINRVTVQNGGYNYNKDYLPTLSVNSSGIGAVLEVEHFMGQDAEFTYVSGDGIQGKILSIKVLNPGKGYTVTPIVDLTFSGDGKAKAVANIRSSFVKLPGRWLTSDSLLSDDEIRLQGKDYYVDFSYVINSKIEFQRYKTIVKDLLNPVGSVNYAKYLILDKINPEIKYLVFDEFSRQLAGTVNVASELPTVWGTNTYFEIANNIGLIAEGTYILVNSEIRIINAIINNVTLTVSEPYEYNANDQLVTIVPVPYRAIVTEYWRELSINIEGPRTIVLTTEEDY
jgi:hypothetical protein